VFVGRVEAPNMAAFCVGRHEVSLLDLRDHLVDHGGRLEEEEYA